MKGIQPNPIAVVDHFATEGGTNLVFLNRNREIAQIRLTVKPGITTEANICQTIVSAAEWETFLNRSDELLHGS